MSTVPTREAVSPLAEKTLGDFVSQGSAGGAISLFLLTLIGVLRRPNGYAFLLIAYLPFVLFIGAVLGAAGGIFVWLVEPIFKLRLGVLVRSSVTVGMIALVLAVVGFFKGAPLGLDLLIESLTTAGVIGLPITILISSNISLWWLVLFGSDRMAAADWFSLLAAFVLRLTSLAGFLISLFFLAWWGSFPSGESRLNPYWIAIAILYFAASSYFGFKPPGRTRLVIAALLLNAPLAVWALNEYAVAEPDTKGLATIAFFLIGLWTVLVVCLLMDRRFFPRPGKSAHEANPLLNKGT
jgi:hypothetical protein